ncbi:Phosphate regulon transcriptional regulatory protein PhoB [Alteripontixanthobacter maritimus]|uniref:Phosphate regulon transcriptional regulatory protein PhoB n=1 Tax=Alteripontixanthobacter maritimus TaxID=2161824 RepID=A0A369QBB3_9SPHN|nr:response regulator transcription factor [Alteripontixanthobacter maritimus]RDC60855.1 Phosphate regulon transcriptional regulatory protein PhoB [Alteripontixanthobacter maritimus]
MLEEFELMHTIRILSTRDFMDDAPTILSGGMVYEFERLDIDGLDSLKSQSVWVYIDWIMPEISGLELCHRLRAIRSADQTRITLMLERDRLEDRRRAIDAGADNYLIEPLTLDVITAQIAAISGQAMTDEGDRLAIGHLSLDEQTSIAFWKDEPLFLSPTLLRLMKYFIENANRLLTREEILASINVAGQELDARSVDVAISRIRKELRKVGAGAILRTVRSRGYVLDLRIG